MLVDSHCHLDYLARDGDLEEALERARRAGVGRMLTIGTKLSAFNEVKAIADANDDVYCSVGIHPHEADEEGLEGPEKLLEIAEDPKVAGIGETGLDYFYEHSQRDKQQRSFRAHIEASRQSGLPLIVHARDADEDTIEILQEEYKKGAYPAVIHCFTAGPELAKASLEMGFYISLAGIVTFKKADDLRDTVRGVPLDRLLVETDSPYLAPVPKRGKRNEPAYVVHTADALAELFGISAAEMAKQTSDNFFNLFKKIPRPEAA